MLYTIKQFIKHGVHLGHYKWECDYRLSYFLLGLRNSIHIINLYHTLFSVKKALYIAYNMCVSGNRILIANNVGYKLDSNLEKIHLKQLSYINHKWIGGLLSNQRGIFIDNENIFFKFYGLAYDALLPSYVFASNVKETSSCIFEATVLDIPSSALLDSNMGYYGIFYGFPSNDDNFVSIYLFTRLFIKMYVKSLFDSVKNLIVDFHNLSLKTYKSMKGMFQRFKFRKMKYSRKWYWYKFRAIKYNFYIGQRQKLWYKNKLKYIFFGDRFIKTYNARKATLQHFEFHKKTNPLKGKRWVNVYDKDNKIIGITYIDKKKKKNYNKNKDKNNDINKEINNKNSLKKDIKDILR